MRTARKLSIVLVALVVMTVGLAVPAQAGTEGAFLSKINASRSAAGLPPLSMSSELVPNARSHSAEMMAAGSIFHTSDLGGVASGWEALAENVGVGPSVESLHTAFMNSSGHRSNILGDYNYAGVGVAEADGQIWVTVIFMRKGSAPETTTTTAAPDSATTTIAPEPTTTTTTAPSATTTEPFPQAAAAAAPASVPVRTPSTYPAASPRAAQDAASSTGQPPYVQALHLPLAD